MSFALTIFLTKKGRRMSLMTLGLLFAAPFVQANIFYKDLRTSQPAGKGALTPIGSLTKIQTGTHGTAFLVSPCYILTNFHVAYADSFTKPEKTLFQVGESSSLAMPVAAGKMTSPQAENGEDWALLRLDQCLGQQLGYFELAGLSLEQATKKKIIMAGYPFDRSSANLTLSPLCHIDSHSLASAGGWRHDCASRAGSSGSPLLIEKTPGHFQVIALNTTEVVGFDEIIGRYDISLSNGATPVAPILAQILPLLQADR